MSTSNHVTLAIDGMSCGHRVATADAIRAIEQVGYHAVPSTLGVAAAP